MTRTVTKRQKFQYSFLFMLVLLCAVLLLMFQRALLPENTLFANDGPLGQQLADWSQATTDMLGSWNDINWLGSAEMSGVPNVWFLIQRVGSPAYWLLVLLWASMMWPRMSKSSSVAARIGACCCGAGATYLSLYASVLALAEPSCSRADHVFCMVLAAAMDAGVLCVLCTVFFRKGRVDVRFGSGEPYSVVYGRAGERRRATIRWERAHPPSVRRHLWGLFARTAGFWAAFCGGLSVLAHAVAWLAVRLSGGG
jgi:hypothetical protein